MPGLKCNILSKPEIIHHWERSQARALSVSSISAWHAGYPDISKLLLTTYRVSSANIWQKTTGGQHCQHFINESRIQQLENFLGFVEKQILQWILNIAVNCTLGWLYIIIIRWERNGKFYEIFFLIFSSPSVGWLHSKMEQWWTVR